MSVPYKFPDTRNGIKILEHLPFELKAKRYVIAECPSCEQPWRTRMDCLHSGKKCKPCADKASGIKRTKHGMSPLVGKPHPVIQAWYGMKARCNGNGEKATQYYLEKGITICKEWIADPMSFIEWSFKNGWEKGLELDKDILCDKLNISPKIYSPETCQWITKKENRDHARNTTNSKRNNSK